MCGRASTQTRFELTITDTCGAQLTSQSMSESEYTRALITLGCRDAMAQSDELRDLLPGEGMA